MRRRCPRCGAKGIFQSWFRLSPKCPGCGLAYAREEGYWVTAIIINTAATEIVFGILFIGTLIATWPGIPWQPLLAVALATNGIFPIFFYPFSKTLWVAIDLYVHPGNV